MYANPNPKLTPLCWAHKDGCWLVVLGLNGTLAAIGSYHGGW